LNNLRSYLFPFFQKDFLDVLKVPEWLTFIELLPKCVADMFHCIEVWTVWGSIRYLNIMGIEEILHHFGYV
jgi:hypothetical protein